MSCESSSGECRCPDDATVISSFLTPIFKFILPILMTVLFGGSMLSSIANDVEGFLFILVLWIAFSLIILWRGIRLKWVAFDDENVYISNYLKMISVPLADIEKITEHIFAVMRPVSIAFSHETEFGRKIFFTPKVYLLSPFFGSHLIIERLRGLVAKRKKEG